MNCLHPKMRTMRDATTGEYKLVEFPCGKCENCLHAIQDGWSIRLCETAKKAGQFIYDTLTFAPGKLPTVDISDAFYKFSPDGGLKPVDGVKVLRYNEFKTPYYTSERLECNKLSEESQALLDYWDMQIPFVQRQLLTNWLKRGREQYYRHYGKRPDFRYMICEEYGPVHARPHFHGVFFGVSFEDYMRFWGTPWKEQFGFTKPNLCKSSDIKSYECISRYVTKYVTKGSYECPLVADRILPKTFRAVSKGIGREYLENPIFQPWKAKSIQLWTDYNRDSGLDLNLFISQKVTPLKRLSKLTDKDFTALTTYYDRQGYPHALPRYYRSKILKSDKPNLLNYEVQNILLARSEQRNYSELQAFAATLGLQLDPRYSHYPLLGLSDSEHYLLYNKFTAAQENQRKAKAERRKIRLKNHYNRLRSLPASAVSSGLYNAVL